MFSVPEGGGPGNRGVNHVSKNVQPIFRNIELRKPSFFVLLISTEVSLLCIIWRIVTTPQALRDDEWGNGENIDCCVIPLGKFTPSINVIHNIIVHVFRTSVLVDVSTNIPPYVAGFTLHGIVSQLSDSETLPASVGLRKQLS